MDPHPIVGGIVHMSYLFIFGWQVSYLLPLRCGVVSLVRYDIGMVSDWAEVTVVPSILAG
jgi:hypothetical protein